MTRRILVTGANKGIGLAIVEAILEEHDDAFVFLGSRDLTRGAAARHGLVDAHPGWGSRVEVVQLDVTSDASVAAAAAALGGRFEGEARPLYGLVNNAGIGRGSADLRGVLEVNTVGVRRVCEAFVPLLQAPGGRIVNVTSASGPVFVSRCSSERQRFFLNPDVSWAQIEALLDECLALGSSDDFAAAGLGNGDAYGLSKACANSYTLLLARAHPDLKVNACTPGYIATDINRAYIESSGKTAEELGMKPPSAGTRSPLFLLFGEVEGNGRYYGSDALRSPLHQYRDPGTPAYDGD